LGGGFAEGGEGFFEGGGVFYVGGGESAGYLAIEAGEDFAGAYFDVIRDVRELEFADAVYPADGSGDLADEGVADGVWVEEKLGVDVAGYREVRVVKGDGLELMFELNLGGHHERAVEGAADGEHDGSLGTEFFAEFGGAGYGGGRAGDDGLVGGVEVGGGDDFGGELGGDGGASGFDVGEVEAEDGGHGSLAGGDGGLHELAAEADGADGVGEGEGVGGDVGRVLAEGVAGGVVDAEVAGLEFVFEDAEGGDGDGKDGGLGVLGELEGVFGAVEDDVGEGKAEGVVGFFEDGAGGWVGVVEGSTHAYGLGALTGEEESDFGGGGGGDHLG
jgi:hypothetical protein